MVPSMLLVSSVLQRSIVLGMLIHTRRRPFGSQVSCGTINSELIGMQMELVLNKLHGKLYCQTYRITLIFVTLIPFIKK